MAKDNLLQLAAFGLVSGVGLIYSGYRKFRVRRKIEDLPTSRIGLAAQGLVEFQGKARPYGGKVFVSADGSQALFAQVTIEQYVSGKNGGWKKRFSYEIGERFLIEDDTGVAHVLVKGAELHLKSEIIAWDSLGSFRQQGFLALSSGKVKAPFLMATGQWRVIESKVVADEDLLVIGMFKTRQNEPEVVVTSPGSSQPERRMKSSGGLMKDPIHPLVLADGTQQEVLSRVNHGVWIMILGAAAISVGVVFGILEYLDFHRA